MDSMAPIEQLLWNLDMNLDSNAGEEIAILKNLNSY
jgi:hypothetical protein